MDLKDSRPLLAKNQLDFDLVVGILESLKDTGAGTDRDALLELFQGSLSDDWSSDSLRKWAKMSEGARRKKLERLLNSLRAKGLVCTNDKAGGRKHFYLRTLQGKEYVTSTPSKSPSLLQQSHISTLLQIYMPAQEFRVVEASVFPEAEPHFESLSQWFRVVPDRQTYARAPDIDEDLLEDLLHALREKSRIKALYRSKVPIGQSREARWREINPLWLVMRNGVLYLVATLDGTEAVPENLRQLAVHRIEHLEICEDLPISYPENYSVDDYISSFAFDYPMQAPRIELVLRIFASSWYDPKEYPLSEHQTVENTADGQLRVTVPEMVDTWELRRWLLGMAQHAEILEPASLRRWFHQTTQEMARLYEQ